MTKRKNNVMTQADKAKNHFANISVKVDDRFFSSLRKYRFNCKFWGICRQSSLTVTEKEDDCFVFLM